VRLGRTRKDAGRQFAPLYIGVIEPEQANHLIEQGLILGSVLHNCEPFFKECQVTQCIKRQRYGHIAKYCTNIMQCGFYAALGHHSKDCSKQEDTNAHKCAICKANHIAWPRQCQVREQQYEEAKQARSMHPTRFQEHRKHTTFTFTSSTQQSTSPRM
jgi:hypothetical protein